MKKFILAGFIILSVSVVVWANALINASTYIGKTVSVPSADNQAITWTDQRTNVVLPTGSLVIKAISFRANGNLDDLQFRLTPGLTRFVAAQPQTMIGVVSGSVNQIQLAFLAPDGTTVGTYEGTLHVISGNRTLPQTFKITLTVTSSLTSTWSETANDGYTIKYPPDWSFDLMGNGTLKLFTLGADGDPSTGSTIYIYTINNVNGLTVSDYLAQKDSVGVSAEGETEFGYPAIDPLSVFAIPVNGIRSLKFASTHGFTGSNVFVPQGTRFIVVESQNTEDDVPIDQILDQILSTLRF